MGSHLADALVMAGHEVPSFINSNKKLVYTPGGGGDGWTPYNGLYGKALPKRGTFLGLMYLKSSVKPPPPSPL